MHRLADELRETFSERGFGIEKAVSIDPAFKRTRRSQSSLVRDLVLDGVRAATARIGLGYDTVAGGGCEVQAIMENVDYRFRVRKARVDPDTGDYEIVAGHPSIMTISDAEPDGLYPTERWVLGYTVDADGTLVQIFAAQVYGLSDDAVPRLLLGPPTELGTAYVPPSPGGGFHPDPEDELEGMDWPEEGEEGGDTVASA